MTSIQLATRRSAADRMSNILAEICSALEARGHKRTPKGLAIGGHDITLTLREIDRVTFAPLTKQDFGYRKGVAQQKRVLVPSGRLMLTAAVPSDPYIKFTVKESVRRPLEKRRDAIIERLERVPAEILAHKQCLVDLKIKIEEESKQAALRLYRRQERENKSQNLRDASDDWIAAANIRCYLDALEAKLAAGPAAPEYITEWLTWARGYAETLDPLSDEGIARLHRHAQAVAYHPVDDDEQDEEHLWFHDGSFHKHLEALQRGE